VVFERAVEFVDEVGDGGVEDAMSESRRVFVGVAAIDNSSKRAIDSSRWLVLEITKIVAKFEDKGVRDTNDFCNTILRDSKIER
jgi:hypothetical protein